MILSGLNLMGNVPDDIGMMGYMKVKLLRKHPILQLWNRFQTAFWAQ